MGGPLTACPTSLGLKGQTGDSLLMRRVYTSVKDETVGMESDLHNGRKLPKPLLSQKICRSHVAHPPCLGLRKYHTLLDSSWEA